MSTRAGRLVVQQGVDWEYGWPVSDRTPGAPPLAMVGWTARAQARPTPESGVVLAEWTTENGGIRLVPGSTATDGTVLPAEVVLVISAALSSAWPWREAHYDVELLDAQGQVARIAGGRMFVSREVTR